jgi:hypothetical protein
MPLMLNRFPRVTMRNLLWGVALAIFVWLWRVTAVLGVPAVLAHYPPEQSFSSKRIANHLAAQVQAPLLVRVEISSIWLDEKGIGQAGSGSHETWFWLWGWCCRLHAQKDWDI